MATATNRCECSDPGCPCCHGKCDRKAVVNLYRVDMDDETGICFCDGCANDAAESGVFSHEGDTEGCDLDDNPYA